jgi:hypothetical protein
MNKLVAIKTRKKLMFDFRCWGWVERIGSELNINFSYKEFYENYRCQRISNDMRDRNLYMIQY